MKEVPSKKVKFKLQHIIKAKHLNNIKQSKIKRKSITSKFNKQIWQEKEKYQQLDKGRIRV